MQSSSEMVTDFYTFSVITTLLAAGSRRIGLSNYKFRVLHVCLVLHKITRNKKKAMTVRNSGSMYLAGKLANRTAFLANQLWLL